MADEYTQEMTPAQENPLGEKLAAMLSDPESMARLAKMASSLAGSGLLDSLGAAGGIGSDGTTGATALPSETTTDDSEQKNAAPPQVLRAGMSGKNRHTALLQALKPYLRAEKRERIDRMLKLLQLADLAGTVLYSDSQRENGQS